MKDCIVKALPISKTNLKLQLSNAKAFLRYSKLVHREITKYHKIYKLDNTYQLCDGFTAILLEDMIDGLELSQEKYDYLDVRLLVNNCKNELCDYEKIDIDMELLKQYANIAKKT